MELRARDGGHLCILSIHIFILDLAFGLEFRGYFWQSRLDTRETTGFRDTKFIFIQEHKIYIIISQPPLPPY